MAQGAKQVDINTYFENTYVSGRRDSGGLTVDVTKDIPWDKLSKIFKRYTYAIEYQGDYEGQYNIIVVPKSSRITTDTFQYKEPKIKVLNVEVFFKGDANVTTTEPLVVRFIHEGEIDNGDGSNKYYKWSKLKGQTENGTISRESFKEKDLVTVLLEELGYTGGVSDRKDKLVIRLNERPPSDGDHGSTSKYPESGYYQNKQVTVTKAGYSDAVTGYDGYVHTVGDRVNASEFYVSYDNDSRYFKIGPDVESNSGSNLHSVTGYFETGGSRTKNLVLITFSFRKVRGMGDGKSYGYSYYDFFNDLKNVKSASDATDSSTVKEIVSGDAIEGGIQKKLQEEKSKLTPLIEFKEGGLGSDENKNINTSGLQEVGADTLGQGYKFKKYEMTPEISEVVPKGGGEVVPGGPWTVFCTKLFIDNKSREIGANPTIPKDVLNGIFTGSGLTDISKKYSAITVYYATKTGRTDDYSDYSALLVEFCAGNGDKKYIKRVKGDNQWADAISDIGGDGVSAQKLTQIAKKAGIIVVSSTSPVGDSSPDSQDGNLGATIGKAVGGIAGVGGVGAGVGYAIYKYPQVFLSLIGR